MTNIVSDEVDHPINCLDIRTIGMVFAVDIDTASWPTFLNSIILDNDKGKQVNDDHNDTIYKRNDTRIG